MTDLIKTILVRDSRLNGLSDYQTVAVQQGAANNTFQRYRAISTSNSSIIWNITVPSESIVINREILMSTNLTFTIRISNVPVGQMAFDLGRTDSMNAFPLANLMNTLTVSINNTSVPIQLQIVFLFL